jgi:hypothetical protein
MDQQEIAFYYRKAIERFGSQGAFGAKVRSSLTGEGVSQATISDWMMGKKTPGCEYLPSLARALWPTQGENAAGALLEHYYGYKAGSGGGGDDLTPGEREFISLFRQLPAEIKREYESMGRTLARQT